MTRLLIIDDDLDFSRIVANRLSSQGFDCAATHHTSDALLAAREHQPECILLDMKLADDSGLNLIAPLRQLLPDSRIVLLTGYASIATAVAAMKAGADDYLTKPADTATMTAALTGCRPAPTMSEAPMSPERLEWEHIQQVLKANHGNVSHTAKQLNMHRRTLQRKLKKRPASE
ncbi:response regulator [Corallincola holothuriorum]|uniref:Response regulator n=1 Tax=Corallincola holothuriorum TaxID=2282215 RepID=A0A368NMR9_9GAMM|nr:response regulator [Corallincola holothuriorum]RCU50954.1 response regulator [Corallincola holothuriorum]